MKANTVFAHQWRHYVENERHKQHSTIHTHTKLISNHSYNESLPSWCKLFQHQATRQIGNTFLGIGILIAAHGLPEERACPVELPVFPIRPLLEQPMKQIPFPFNNAVRMQMCISEQLPDWLLKVILVLLIVGGNASIRSTWSSLQEITTVICSIKHNATNRLHTSLFLMETK